MATLCKVTAFLVTLWLQLFLLPAANGQYNQATTSSIMQLNNGLIVTNKWWIPNAATPAVQVLVASTTGPAMPTLYWNCQMMPAICANVAAWRQQNPATNVLPQEFVFDIAGSGTRTEKRREEMCEKTDWRVMRAGLIAAPGAANLPQTIWYINAPGHAAAGVIGTLDGQQLIPGSPFISNTLGSTNPASGLQ
ncbi:hypothetical protein TWF730_003129 [Orbilia blumenaviensis]|uniref:Uncharacterized protein n=1 Tax=Orbilia blumenaviensis TaxID=1796055 RepID=A0AAV9U7X5_9PEZI